MAIVQCLEATNMDQIQNLTTPQLTAATPYTFDIESRDTKTWLTANGVFTGSSGVNYAGHISAIAVDSADYGLFPNLYITTSYDMTTAAWTQLFSGGQFRIAIAVVLYGDDTFYGSAGTDRLLGSGVNDVFMTSDGADTFIGGSGTNSVNYAAAGPGLV